MQFHFDQQPTEETTYWQSAKQKLAKLYGVDDLTPIEAVRLKEFSNEALHQIKEEQRMYKEGKIKLTNPFDPITEAVERWMWFLYGIKGKDVPTNYFFRDSDGNNYVCRNIAEYDQKREELRRKKKETYTIKIETAPEFKEYFKRIRNQAGKL